MTASAREALATARRRFDDAQAAAANLRDRVRSGGTVTPRQLAEADAAAELAELGIEQLEQRAAEELQAERDGARAAAADMYLDAEAAARADFAAAAAAVRAALAEMAAASDRHAAVIRAITRDAARLGDGRRLRRDAVGQLLIDGSAVQGLTPIAWARLLAAEVAPEYRGDEGGLWPPTV